jgi:PD-(D/E)XK nuclease superfamily
MVVSPAQLRSFVDDAVEWRRGSEASLLRMIRSSCSGVPHDVGAAYATLATRTGNLLDAIDAGLLALPTLERDSALLFAARARKVRSSASEGEGLRAVIEATFALKHNSSLTEPSEVLSEERSDESKGIELAETPAAEPLRGAPAWEKHFSASALNTYAECPRKWFYRYACAAVEDPGSAASAYGTAFHLALEDFHGEFPQPKSTDGGVMRNRIREYVTWAFQRNRNGFETQVEFELAVRRAQRTSQRYVDWLLAQAKEAPFEVLGREVAANLDLDGRPFVGYIDRLDRDERSGGIGVVDYKTGSIATSASEYCDRVRRFEDFQLPFYYWARTGAGDRVTRLVLIPLKDALLDVRPIVLEVSPRPPSPSRKKDDACGGIGVNELEESRARMVELSDQLSSGNILHFETTTNPVVCTYCAYATSCAARPPAEARRFGS